MTGEVTRGTVSRVTTFGSLHSGDRIICPGTGHEEVVTNRWRGAQGHVVVRTNKHDHVTRPDRPVTRLEEE